ncbi:hypothetical protein [Photobacterium iliopiscarium]|uniref:Type I restriction modification DNA specificity domain-containing protein n=1 Tax=Photobacterium iliopiscarium TaxID=56192 RepID=A0A2T3M9J0_9GAMM|nr:hypothetical protein [Photobacterium iliopiscarium]PSV89360.1 hypothetical protein C9I88_18980 [Photobacterium iliopiscarium]
MIVLDGLTARKSQPQVDALALVVPVAPLAEQHHIVAKVDELMGLCDQLKANLLESEKTQLYITNAIVEQAL